MISISRGGEQKEAPVARLFIVWRYCGEVSSASALRLICQIGTKNLEGSRTQKVGDGFWVPEFKIPKSYFQRYGAVILLTRHVFCFASHSQNWTPLVVPAKFQNPKKFGGNFRFQNYKFRNRIFGFHNVFRVLFYFIFFSKLEKNPFVIK